MEEKKKKRRKKMKKTKFKTRLEKIIIRFKTKTLILSEYK
jgi:hypothetical protein